jgi:hypothetical protein
MFLDYTLPPLTADENGPDKHGGCSKVSVKQLQQQKGRKLE